LLTTLQNNYKLYKPTRDFFSAEQDKTKKRPGRPKEYPDSLIIFTLIIKFLMRFAYRQLQGYLSSLFAGSGFKVPNFRTIHYIIDFESLPDNFVMAIDATGLKLYNRGAGFGCKSSRETSYSYPSHFSLTILIRTYPFG